MDPVQQLVVFNLDERVYALRVSAVNRIVSAVLVEPLPGAPGIVLGVINVGGEIVPVFDVRKRFGLPPKLLTPSDKIVLGRTERRQVALVVDAVSGVVEAPPLEVVGAGEILGDLPYIEGVVTLPDGLAVIHDLGTFLGFEEAKELDEALAAGATDRR